MLFNFTIENFPPNFLTRARNIFITFLRVFNWNMKNYFHEKNMHETRCSINYRMTLEMFPISRKSLTFLSRCASKISHASFSFRLVSNFFSSLRFYFIFSICARFTCALWSHFLYFTYLSHGTFLSRITLTKCTQTKALIHFADLQFRILLWSGCKILL